MQFGDEGYDDAEVVEECGSVGRKPDMTKREAVSMTNAIYLFGGMLE